MRLLLLRHADAESSAPSDDLRPLSEKGRSQAGRVGRFCAARSICPELILVSPFLRADETARIVAKELERECVLAAFLASGMTPAAALEGLRAYLKFDCLMLVGHEPDFGQLAATLLGLPDPGALHIRKASLTCLDVDSLRPGGARLDFLVPAKLMNP